LASNYGHIKIVKELLYDIRVLRKLDTFQLKNINIKNILRTDFNIITKEELNNLIILL
jgi:hypothetical protein